MRDSPVSNDGRGLKPSYLGIEGFGLAGFARQQ